MPNCGATPPSIFESSLLLEELTDRRGKVTQPAAEVAILGVVGASALCITIFAFVFATCWGDVRVGAHGRSPTVLRAVLAAG